MVKPININLLHNTPILFADKYYCTFEVVNNLKSSGLDYVGTITKNRCYHLCDDLARMGAPIAI